ncbi:MAG: helix-turn-helix domain-containing protein [Bacteroidales bacterium]|nr:helix-turn-helix domain-containing protein [Bacteroidales bacterium]
MRKINITDLPRETKITLTIGDLHDFFEALIQQHEASKLKTIYDTKEACELLGVNRQTLAYYRNEGYLGYSRHGDKFWYSQKDIEDFLAYCYRAPFRQQ